MSNLLPLALAYGPVTEEQQRRVDEAEARVRARREFAQYDLIMEKRQPIAERRRVVTINPDGSAVEEVEATGEISCARCTHIGDFNAEHERGWCMFRRRMVSTWHPAKCKAFELAA